MNAEEIRALVPEEIQDKVLAVKKELYTLRVQAKTGQLEKQHRMKELKRDIARLLTIQKELLAKKTA